MPPTLPAWAALQARRPYPHIFTATALQAAASEKEKETPSVHLLCWQSKNRVESSLLNITYQQRKISKSQKVISQSHHNAQVVSGVRLRNASGTPTHIRDNDAAVSLVASCCCINLSIITVYNNE